MAKPIPTLDQTAAIQAEIAGNTAQSNALTSSIPLQDPIIAQKQKVDDAFKSLFSYYNTDIIGKYDAERKSIAGVYVSNPVTESDILAVGGNPASGRLVPTPPATDIIRVAEFDGTAYTATVSNYEQKHITDQASVESTLVTGYGAGTYPATLLTDSSITPTSTTLKLKDTAVTIALTAGTVFIVASGGDLAVVKITTITANNPPTPPPYQSDLVIELIVPPIGTISSGQTLESFTGFTNTERTSKTAIVKPSLQPLMNYLVAQLQARINDRISRLLEQITALTANQDTDGAVNINAAKNNANTSKTFLTNYLIGTDISDTGLASLSTERATRSGQLTARLAQIIAAYTGQTENYYEQRYQTANNRGNTQRGTLRAVENAKQVKTTLQNMATGLASANTALSGIIP